MSNPATSTSSIHFSLLPKVNQDPDPPKEGAQNTNAVAPDANDSDSTSRSSHNPFAMDSGAPRRRNKRFMLDSFRKNNSTGNLSLSTFSDVGIKASQKKTFPSFLHPFGTLFALPFKIFLKIGHYLTNPEKKVATMWMTFMMLVSVYNFVGVTIRCTFLQTYHLTWYTNPLAVGLLSAFDLLFDIVFFFDILLGFITPYTGDDGVLVFDVKKTALRYLSLRKGWFYLDIITAFPFDWIPLIVFTPYVAYFRLNRVFRLVVKFLHYFSHYENYVNISSSITRIFKFIFVVILITHCVTCVWYLISISEEPQNTIMWTNMESLPYRSIWEIYLYAFHWCLVSMTGYGGTISASLKQVVFSEIVVALGVAMFVTVIGTLGSLISNLDANASKNRQKLDEIKEYMKYRRLPSYLVHRIINYYTFLFKSRKGWDEEKILNDLPQYLRVEVALDMNRKIVEKVELFKNTSRMFIGSVVLSLMPRMILPGTAIVRRGEIGREMYFIASGFVHVLSPADDKTVLAKLGEGSFFGEIALIYDSLRVCTVVAGTYCDLYVLTKEAFERIEEDYPDQVRRIREMAAKRRDGGQNKNNAAKNDNESNQDDKASNKTENPE